MKNLLILFLVVSQLSFSQSREVSGTVSDGEYPFPGVNVIVKGTKIGTQTDFDGNFNITVPDSLNILVFSYVGMVTKEVDVRDQNHDNKYVLEQIVILMEDSTICYFYPQFIDIKYYSGLNHSKLGFLIEFTDPYIFRSPIVPEFKLGYQTNSKENSQLLGEFNLVDVFRVGNRSFSFNTIYCKIKLENYKRESIRLETETDMKTIFRSYSTISIGIGKAKEITNTILDKQLGFSIGIEQYLFSGFIVKTKLTKWDSLLQLQTGLSYNYHGFNIIYELNLIDNYTENNVGIGYRFSI